MTGIESNDQLMMNILYLCSPTLYEGTLFIDSYRRSVPSPQSRIRMSWASYTPEQVGRMVSSLPGLS